MENLETTASYRKIRLLGKGGMGEVFEAEAPDGRRVALKVFHAEKSRRRNQMSPLSLTCVFVRHAIRPPWNMCFPARCSTQELSPPIGNMCLKSGSLRRWPRAIALLKWGEILPKNALSRPGSFVAIVVSYMASPRLFV